MKTTSSLFAVVALVALGLMSVGCDQGPKLVPIEGRVTLDGQPVTYGDIRVIPSSGRPAFGSLDEQGRFKLFTDEHEGCAVGTHIVTLNSAKSISETDIRRHAPAKYDSGVTSDVKLEVNEPNKDVVIELQGDGKRYPFDYRG